MQASRTRWTISVLAILGTVPYLTLKVAWLSGSRIGLTDPDFGRSPVMHVANALTLGLDAVAVLMALAFVTHRGRRLRAWLVLLPMWVGTGLLAPILLIVPLQLLVGGSSSGSSSGSGAEDPIAGWVYAMVYGGFMWQGAFLLTGFVLYAAARWGPDVTGPGSARPDRAVVNLILTALALAATLTAVVALLAAPRGDGRLAVVDLVATLALLLAGAAGLAMIALRGDRAPGWPAVVLAWLGSGAAAAWGLYSLVLLVVPNDLVGGRDVATAEVVAQALRLAAGVLVAWSALRLVRPRAVQQSGSDAGSGRVSVRSSSTLVPQPDHTSR